MHDFMKVSPSISVFGHDKRAQRLKDLPFAFSLYAFLYYNVPWGEFDIIRDFLLNRICYQEEAITSELAIGDNRKNAEPTLLLTCDQV